MNLEEFIRDLKKDWVKVVEESQRVQYIEVNYIHKLLKFKY